MYKSLSLDELYVTHLKLAGIYGIVQRDQKGFNLNWFVFILHMIFLIPAVPFALYNVEVVEKNMYYYIWHILLIMPLTVSSLDILIFVFNRERINRIWSVCRLEFLESSDNNCKATILNNFIKRANRNTLTLLYVSLVNTPLWILTAMLPKNTEHFKLRDSNRTIGLSLFEIYYPFEHDRWPYLHLIFLHELTVLFCVSCFVPVIPISLQIFTTMFCGQIHVLQNTLEKLRHDTFYEGKLSRRVVHSFVRNKGDFSMNLASITTQGKFNSCSIINAENNVFGSKLDQLQQEKLYCELKKIIRDYQKLVMMFQEFRAVYNLIVSVILSGSCLGVGLIGLKLLRTGVTVTVENLRDVVYLANVMACLCVCCYNGNVIKCKSESLHGSLYNCDWVHGNKNFKQDLGLFMIRAQRPIALTAFQCIDVDLIACLQVMKLSYTYLTALYKVSQQ